MSVKRIFIVVVALLAVAAAVVIYFARRNDFYDKLARQAAREIQEANQKPAINIGSNDNRLPYEVIQTPGSAKIVRDDKTSRPKTVDKGASPQMPQVPGPASVGDENQNRRMTKEYYSGNRKLIAIEHFGEGGKLVRRDIYDDQRRVRLKLFYNNAGKVVYEEAFDEKGLKVRSQPIVPILPVRGIY